METNVLFSLALIIILAKGLEIVSKRIHIPQVVGSLLAGIILGPTIFNIVKDTNVIESIASIGIALLMFEAGLETDFKRLRSDALIDTFIASAGAILPLISGTILGLAFKMSFLEAAFIGVILSATSVGITVEALKEKGRLDSRVGSSILGAAIIDDIIGVILLTILNSRVTAQSGELLKTLLMLLGFFIISIFAGFVISTWFDYLGKSIGRKRRIPVFALGFCFILSYVAEVMGASIILGAYLAGLILANTNKSEYIKEKVQVVSYMLVSPVFFATIGLRASIILNDSNILAFSIILILIAILTKLLGCAFAARLSKFSWGDSLKIGAGMISRGEVALVIATIGVDLGVIERPYYAAVVLMIIATSIIAPIALQFFYSIDKDKAEDIY